MAGDSKKVQPIIIKRIKKGGHAAHGGAWKIAYADFVTAMMAFFLLMWLLGSTTEGDRKGIADYFNSPLKVAFFGGSGAGDASSILKGGGNNLAESTGQMKKGATTESVQERARKRAIRAEQAAAEAQGSAMPDKPEDLTPLGLTPRENEVLFWLIQGKANADIGTILTLSPATVKKHLEHVFEKLGVENRAAAINAALQMLRTPRSNRPKP